MAKNAKQWFQELATEAGYSPEETAALLKLADNPKAASRVETTVKTAEEDYQAQLGRVKTLDAELNDYKVWANGNGTLRDGRKIDKGALAAYQELQQQHQQAQAELARMQNGGLPAEFDTSKLVTREDFQKQLSDRDARYAGVIKQMGRLASQHAVNFKEALDVDALEKLAIETNLPLDVAYERLIGPRVEEARKTAAEADKKAYAEQAVKDALSSRNLPADPTPSATAPIFIQRDKAAEAKNGKPANLDSELMQAWSGAGSTK